jgi:DNA-binding HxlR family transcriptional regulator
MRKDRSSHHPAPEGCASEFCPVHATIEILQQKWTLLILRTLMGGKMRFNELAHAVGGCNSRTLRDRLKTLEEQGIVSRRIVAVMPPWVEYELTPKGYALGGVMQSLVDWSRTWMTPAASEAAEAHPD